MRMLCYAMLHLIAFSTFAASAAPDYPGCDLNTQHDVQGNVGGAITDPRQAHISVRANILQADIATARKVRLLTQPQAEKMWRQVEQVRKDTNQFVKKQGFLSAGERASYDRALDRVASQLCRF